MKIYIVVTRTKTLGTDFPTMIDVFPFKTLKEAQEFTVCFLSAQCEQGVVHFANIYEKEMK